MFAVHYIRKIIAVATQHLKKERWSVTVLFNESLNFVLRSYKNLNGGLNWHKTTVKTILVDKIISVARSFPVTFNFIFMFLGFNVTVFQLSSGG